MHIGVHIILTFLCSLETRWQQKQENIFSTEVET